MSTDFLAIGVDPGKTGAIVAIGQHKDKVNSGGKVNFAIGEREYPLGEAGRYADAPRGTSGGGSCAKPPVRVVSSSEDPLGDERAFDFVMDNQEFEEDRGGAEAFLKLKHKLYARDTMGTSIIVAIERQQYIPKDGRRQGGKSAFTLGENYGRWLGLFEGFGLEVVTVPPQTWQAYIYGGRVVTGIDSKTRAIELAKTLIPDLPLCPDRCRAPRHGRADAGLIALYGLGVLKQRALR